jgi:hypothetical protein
MHAVGVYQSNQTLGGARSTARRADLAGGSLHVLVFVGRVLYEEGVDTGRPDA